MTGQLIFRICLALLWMVLAAGGVRAEGGGPQPAVAVLSADAQAVPLEGRAQYWIEPGRRRSIDEVSGAADLPWATLDLSRQHRLDGAALWIRFDVEQHDGSRWYVALASSGIDRVQLFHHAEGGRWAVEEAGDTRPVSSWPLPGRVPTFELHPGGDRTRYWLRVEHDDVDFAVPVTLYSQGRLLALREREQFLLGAYFGLSVLLALVALFNAIGYRDRLFAVYAVYLVLFTLGQAAYIGVGAQHLWDQWLAWNAESTFLLPALSAPAALWFVQVVTEPARFSRRLNLLVQSLIVLLLLAALLDPVLHSRALMAGRLVLTGASLVLVGVLIGLVWLKADDPDIRIIALGFVPVLVMALFPIARGLNLIPNSIFTRYGLAIGAAVEMPILFYALSRRGSRRRRAESRASALPGSDALTGLADRRRMVLRLEATMARARNQKRPCALVLARLANHEAIATAYGRDTLDRALVVVASYLRRVATDVDLAARVGEREFALLLEPPTSAEAATSRAQHLVASGLRRNMALPADLSLRLLVVVVLLPDQPPDAESTLQWALGALAGIRGDSRKPIRSLNF